MDKYSYTSADINIPIKILHDIGLIESITYHKRILLRHLQLSIINKCNLNCKYCSCSDIDRELKLSLKRIFIILEQARQSGCQAITITGGGEPLFHPKINRIIRECKRLDISVGLVTNGMILRRLKEEVTWCRISFDSDRPFNVWFQNELRRAIGKFPRTGWAFSFVAANLNSLGDLKEVVEFANKMKFTHVRVVSNILNPDEDIIEQARNMLKGIDEKVLYQSRNKPTRGTKKCLISLLKPIIGTDGNVYPCCGVQYALNDSENKFVKEMSMGKGEDLREMNQQQKYFDGSICDICYYQGYNKLLSLLIKKIEHKKWV